MEKEKKKRVLSSRYLVGENQNAGVGESPNVNRYREGTQAQVP